MSLFVTLSLTVIHNLTEHSPAQLLPPSPPWGGRDSLFYCRCRASSRQCASRPRRAKSAAPRRPCVRHRAPHLHWISKATTATADKLSECGECGHNYGFHCSVFNNIFVLTVIYDMLRLEVLPIRLTRTGIDQSAKWLFCTLRMWVSYFSKRAVTG